MSHELCKRLCCNSATYSSDYIIAMNYANSEFTQKQLHMFVQTWVKNNKPNIYDLIVATPEYEFVVIGKIAWMLMNGAYLENKTINYFNEKLAQIEHNHETNPLTYTKPTKVTNYRMYVALYNSLDDLIEDGASDKEYTDIINLYASKKHVLSKALKHYQKAYKECTLSSKNAYKEYFDNDNDIEYRMNCYSLIVHILGAVKNNGIYSNKVHKTKFVYKEKDEHYCLKSVKSEKIKGSKAVIVFDTKLRKLYMYESVNGKALNINNGGIANYSISSIGKHVRKPSELNKTLNKCSTVDQMNELMQDIAGKTYIPPSKITKHMMILKVFA